ncbi:MAG: hypothetical protein HXY50_06585 [Ignavibacteriaceae bacterium]|nr:hypothetical protein [Ignavibacteriaceae bacterium]
MNPKLQTIILVLIFILLSVTAQAQVFIKEKVEVNPRTILSYSPATNAHSVRFEFEWAAVVVPENNHFYNANLNVKTEVKDNCENSLGLNDWAYGWPSGSQTINITNANAYRYDFFIGINGFYDAYQFVDLTLRIYLDNNLDTLYNWRIMGNVPDYYETRHHWVWITDKFNFQIPYPDLDFMGSITDMNYNPDYDCSPNSGVSLVKDMLNLTILNGTEFVSFYDYRTEETVYGSISVHFNELSDIDIQYDRPLYGTEDKYIVIEAESNGIVERDSVKIKPLDYQLEVIVEPDTIAPGDTAIVTVTKKNNDGTITDFDSGQLFEIGMLDGCVLGNIFVGADSGKYFTDVPQPMIFKADANAEVGTVKLRVGLIEQIGGISKSVGGNGNELTTEKEARTLSFNKIRKPTANNAPPPTPENTENFCPGVTPTQRIYKNTEFVVGGDWIELIEPNNETGDRSITAEPSMPNLHIKLRIKGLVQGTLKCSLKVNWKNLDQAGHPVYGATIEVPAQDQNSLFPIYEWDMNWNNIIVGGDDIKLDVEYTSIPYKVFKKTFKVPIKVLGKDQIEETSIRGYVSTQLTEPFASHMKIVIYFESTWEQFWGSGYPKVVYHPHDWGLCGLSKERPTIAEIWNWKENVNSGIQILMEKYNWSLGYPQRVRNGTTWYIDKKGKKQWRDPIYPHSDDWYPHAYTNALNFNEEQVWKETHQRYLSGAYWRWYPNDPRNRNSTGEWKAEPSRKKHRRGELAWEKFINFPPEWR